MKTLNIITLATAIAIIAVATVGVTLAQNYHDSPYYGMMGYSSTSTPDNDWWIEMQEHMEDHWNEVDQTTDGDWWDEMVEYMDDHLDDVPQEIQDEEWFTDMRTYMETHIDEVQSQDWFDEMTQFMEEQDFGGYGFRGCH
ncbi:MAG: hypothetical protein P8X91_04790 [Candidatus Bathyarchaeota archaeon]|jgi:hypothetical protein